MKSETEMSLGSMFQLWLFGCRGAFFYFNFLQGNVIKQGPAPPDVITGQCDEECCKEESSHWVFLYIITLEHKDPEDFEFMIDYFHNRENGNVLMSNVILHIYDAEHLTCAFGDSYQVKNSVDPLTDKIEMEKKFDDDEEVERVACEVFKVNLHHRVNFFNRA